MEQNQPFLVKSTHSAFVIPFLKCESQYPYTYVLPEPKNSKTNEIEQCL